MKPYEQQQGRPNTDEVDFEQLFYENPGQAFQALERKIRADLTAEFTDYENRKTQAAQQKDAWDTLFKRFPTLKTEAAEVREFISQRINEDPELAGMNDLDEGIERLGTEAMDHLRRRKVQREKELEATLFRMPSPDDDPADFVDEGPRRGIVDLLAERRRRRAEYTSGRGSR